VGARPRRRRSAAPKPRFRRWLRRQDRLTRSLVFAVAALSVLVVALIAPRLNGGRRDTVVARGTPAGESTSQAAPRRAPTARIPEPRPRQKARAPQPLPPPKAPPAAVRAARTVGGRLIVPRAAIVIDDLGQNLAHLEQLAGLNIPLSIAVIPGLPASARTASEASRRGIEMLLHQPMEPREEGGKNPGAGVLLTSMTTENLRAQVRANLAAVPGAVGVNNHMGSRFTEDAAGLGALMAEIKEHELFWLDSRTTPGTRGVEVAQAAGVPTLERDIFLDAEVNVDFIRRQVRKLIEAARASGAAVGIGHPHPETIAVLRELRAELLASGVTLVPVSTLVRRNPATGPGTALAAALAVKPGAGEPAATR
jgi:polysaccharide deacetylase 2 family uncharacterized protein YibQ